MIKLINNKKEQTGAVGVKCLRCSLSVSNPSHTHYTQTEVDGVNHTWPPSIISEATMADAVTFLCSLHGDTVRLSDGCLQSVQDTSRPSSSTSSRRTTTCWGQRGTDSLVKDKLQRITKDYNCVFSYYETKS